MQERVVEKKITRVIYTSMSLKIILNIRLSLLLHRTLKGTSNRNYSRARSKHPLSDEIRAITGSSDRSIDIECKKHS